MTLSQEQKDEIRETARELVYEDCLQNWDYLKSVVDAYVDSRETDINRAELVSNDPDLWPEFWDFDPATGKPWPWDIDAPGN